MALSDVKVRSAKPEAKAYKLTDGEGMVLLVHPNGSKYWRLRYRFGGKEKMLALRKYPEVSLADARARRDEARKLLANGVDPSENKKAVKVEQEQEAITFEVVARDWHASNQKWSASHSARVLKVSKIISLLPLVSGTLLTSRHGIYLSPSKRWSHPGVLKSPPVYSSELPRLCALPFRAA